MEKDQKANLAREIRRQKALERLGSNNPRCINCGESNHTCLEEHHIAGRDYDDKTVIACRNCHRTLSDWQKDHPRQETKPPHELEIMGRFLLGVADLFELLIRRLKDFGLKLIELAAASSSREGRS